MLLVHGLGLFRAVIEIDLLLLLFLLHHLSNSLHFDLLLENTLERFHLFGPLLLFGSTEVVVCVCKVDLLPFVLFILQSVHQKLFFKTISCILQHVFLLLISYNSNLYCLILLPREKWWLLNKFLQKNFLPQFIGCLILIDEVCPKWSSLTL